jgi:hypothetical protein
MFHTSRLSWIFSNTEHVHRRGRVLKSLNRLRPHLRTTSYCSTHSKRHVSIQGFGKRTWKEIFSNQQEQRRKDFKIPVVRPDRPLQQAIPRSSRLCKVSHHWKRGDSPSGEIGWFHSWKPLGELPPGVDYREPGPGVVALALALHTHLQCSVQKPRAE